MSEHLLLAEDLIGHELDLRKQLVTLGVKKEKAKLRCFYYPMLLLGCYGFTMFYYRALTYLFGCEISAC